MLDRIKSWWCSLSESDRRNCILVLQAAVSIWLSWKMTNKMIESMAGQSRANSRKAIEILRRTGIPLPIAKRIVREMRDHEFSVINDLVTDYANLDKLDNVKGLKKAKETIDQNLRMTLRLKKNKQLRHLVDVTPGLLMHGPPGCGKTMLARAVAAECGFRFLVVKPSLVRDKFYGESEKIIQATFRLAARIQPIILFIDEIEVLLGSRSDNSFNNGHKNTLIAEFLTAWDGFQQNNHEAVVVIGATNRKECLDDAILRRLPIKIEVALPDKEAREEIFKSELTREGVKLEAHIDSYVNDTDKWNASKISRFLKSVILQAAIEQSPEEDKKQEIESRKSGGSLASVIGSGLVHLGSKVVSSVTSLTRQTKDSDALSTATVPEPLLVIRDSHLQLAMEQFVESSSVDLSHLYT